MAKKNKKGAEEVVSDETSDIESSKDEDAVQLADNKKVKVILREHFSHKFGDEVVVGTKEKVVVELEEAEYLENQHKFEFPQVK